MAERILIQKGRKEFIEELDREVTVVKEKKYYVHDIGKDFHCNEGIIKKEELKNEGVVKTSKGKEFSVIKPSFIDQYKGIERLPQIMPLKDIGMIMAMTGVHKESVVVDAGAGSGAVAIFLAHYVKEVITYDINKKHLDVVKQNIKDLGAKNVTVKEGDVTKQIDEKDVDLIVYDLPAPWEAIESAEKALNVGGFLVSYSPMIIQANDFVDKLKDNPHFIIHKTIELNEREWEIDGRKVRPKSKSTIHSGFLTFARRIN